MSNEPAATEAKQAQTLAPDEVHEYLNKLQTGRKQLPPEASKLEHQVLNNLHRTNQSLRQLGQTKNDVEKQIEQLQARKDQLGRDIEAVSGEATAYAKILLAAEEDRRASVAPAKEASPTATADKLQAVAKAKKGEETVHNKKKPGPPKGVTPPHLAKANASKKGANGATAPAQAAEAKSSEAQAN